MKERRGKRDASQQAENLRPDRGIRILSPRHCCNEYVNGEPPPHHGPEPRADRSRTGKTLLLPHKITVDDPHQTVAISSRGSISGWLTLHQQHRGRAQIGRRAAVGRPAVVVVEDTAESESALLQLPTVVVGGVRERATWWRARPGPCRHCPQRGGAQTRTHPLGLVGGPQSTAALRGTPRTAPPRIRYVGPAESFGAGADPVLSRSSHAVHRHMHGHCSHMHRCNRIRSTCNLCLCLPIDR